LGSSYSIDLVLVILEFTAPQSISTTVGLARRKRAPEGAPAELIT
jgi:hypothetical protein